MNWDETKFNLEEKYGVKIPDDEKQTYNKMMNKGVASSAIAVIIGVIILLLIVVGILINELPMDEHTYIPLGVVVVLIFMEGNNIQRKTLENEKKFIKYIKTKQSGGASMGNIPSKSTPFTGSSINTPSSAPQSLPSTVNSNSTQPAQATPGIKRPIPMVECPICNELIPMGSDPCPKCGTHLQWQ